MNGGSAYKPRSVQVRPFEKVPNAGAIIYLGINVTVMLMQPTRNYEETSRFSSPKGLRPCLALLPVGVAWQPALLPIPVVSYTTFSPLP